MSIWRRSLFKVKSRSCSFFPFNGSMNRVPFGSSTLRMVRSFLMLLPLHNHHFPFSLLLSFWSFLPTLLGHTLNDLIELSLAYLLIIVER